MDKDKNINIKIFLGMIAIIIIIAVGILVYRYIELNPDTVETFEFLNSIKEKNIGTVEITNGEIVNEVYIDEFITSIESRELKEQLTLNIISKNGDVEFKSILKYVPAEGINECIELLNEESVESEYLESGYYELKTEINGSEQIEMFNFNEWNINKKYENGNIKVTIDSIDEQKEIIIVSYTTIIEDISETIIYEIGTFDKLEDNIIHFISTKNIPYKVSISENTKIFNARTSEYYDIQKIEYNDIIIIEKNNNKELEIKVFKNNEEEKLREELLLNLSLEEKQRLYSYNFTIEDIHILGEKEAIITGYVMDNYNIEDYGKDGKKIEFKVMFTENTIFENKSNSNNINNVNNLEYAKANMNTLILDPYTLDEQYPKVVYIKSIDN